VSKIFTRETLPLYQLQFFFKSFNVLGRISTELDPMTAIAEGCAISAHHHLNPHLEKILTNEVTSQGLGIIAKDREGKLEPYLYVSFRFN